MDFFNDAWRSYNAIEDGLVKVVLIPLVILIGSILCLIPGIFALYLMFRFLPL